MLSATVTGMILNHYESALAACLVLNSYIPMLSGTGGNSGTQALSLIHISPFGFSSIIHDSPARGKFFCEFSGPVLTGEGT